MQDKINLGRLYDSIKASIPENATHLMVTLVTAEARGLGLYRLYDESGMFIAELGDETVIVGENPNKRESRLFLSHDFGRRHLIRTVANADMPDGKDAVVFEHRYAENNLVTLPGQTSLIVNGSEPVTGKHPLANQNVRKLN